MANYMYSETNHKGHFAKSIENASNEEVVRGLDGQVIPGTTENINMLICK